MKKQPNIIKNSLLAQTTMIDDCLQSIVGNFNSIHYIQYSQTCIRQSPLGNGLVTSSYRFPQISYKGIIKETIKTSFYAKVNHLMYNNLLNDTTNIDFGR